MRDQRYRSTWDRRLVRILILSLSAISTGCGTGEQALSSPGPEAEFYSRLYQLSRACESRDVERIAAFYAPDATSVSPEMPRNDTGRAAIRATAGNVLARVRTLRVVLTDAVQVRTTRGAVTTTQGFHAEWTAADGAEGTWDGSHVATWKQRDGAFLIAHEELLGSPVMRGRHPGETILPSASVGSPATSKGTTSPPDASATPVPAQVDVAEPPQPEPVEPAPQSLPPPAPGVSRPTDQVAPRAASAIQSRAATFTTPDWTGGPVFVVHFGSFTSRPPAERHAATLAKATGLPARAVQVDLGAKGTWYRSVVGEFQTLRDAVTARESLLRKKRPSGIGLVYRMAASK